MCQPERESLKFELCSDGLDEQFTELVARIKEVAESQLFHWKSFPLVLPTSIAVQNDSPSVVVYTSENGGEDEDQTVANEHVRPIILKDIFIPPSFDELDAVAVDSKGECQKLTPSHLSSIHQKGEFEVESLHFPGQRHRWKVSDCLQKGTERTYDTFLTDLANAASLVVITARNRMCGDWFSIKNSGYALWNSFLGIIDLLFGMPSVEAHNLESRIKEERCNYLVQELCAEDQDVGELSDWILNQVKRAKKEKFNLRGNVDQISVPYSFTTPQGLLLNLKLFNKDIIKKLLPTLISILEKESRGWFLHFREKIISELKAKGLEETNIEKEGNRLVQDEYLRRVFQSILESPSIKELGEDVPQLLVYQATSVLLMHQALDEVEDIYAKAERVRTEDLRRSHPVLSRIRVWLEERLSWDHDALVYEHKWRPHEHATALCREKSLLQHSYFLQRDLAFMREREAVLKKELKNIQVPTRVFEWKTQIWCPQRYIVRRCFQGETDVIPTVLALASTSITTPRSDPNLPIYLLDKQKTRTTSTRYALWRWLNFFYRSWTWTYNMIFILAIWVPICSPLSFRSLFSEHPFMPEFELSQVNGTVCPSKVSITPTLSSRLVNLWRRISKSRTHFESTPDTGFIGKGISRHMNRVWNYLFKGVFGTLLLVTLFPAACLITSFSSLLLAVTAPVWVPSCVFVAQLFFILAYDFDSPKGHNKWFPFLRVIICDFVCLGLLQPLLALVCVMFICPILTMILFLFAYGRRGLRNVWDTVMFHGVIKKKGRIPSSDSFLVRRVAGPGLQDDFIYQISCEQALAAFEARLELDQLAVFEKQMEETISQPLVAYGDFVSKCFGPFSGMVCRMGNFAFVEKEVRDLLRRLNETVEKRRKELSLTLSDSIKSKIKMRKIDLLTCLKQATIILEEFYPQRILNKVVLPPDNSGSESPENSRGSELLEEINRALRRGSVGRSSASERQRSGSPFERYHSLDEWWENRGITPGDYSGLASLMFTEIFSADFLTPLEERSTIFQMEVQGANLSRYTDMIRRIPDMKGMEDKLSVHAPRGNIKIHAPFLDLSCFTPLVKHSVPTGKTKKASLAARLSLRLNPGRRFTSSPKGPEKMLIPLPIPHPAHIAAIIYNRDATENIQLDDESTKAVLKSIENAVSQTSPVSGEVFGSVEDSSGAQSQSSPNLSVYDDPSMYWRKTGQRPGADDSRRQTGGGRSRMATLEISETEPRNTLEDGKKTSKKQSSSTLASLSSGWLSSPLRMLLEGQKPFSVALNLANAEDDEERSDAVDDGAQDSPHTNLSFARSRDSDHL